MEWVLQLVDELDDVIAVLRHGCLALRGDVHQGREAPTWPPVIPRPLGAPRS